MLILHTSDLHLGRSFHGADLLDAQADMLDGLVEVVRAESVELVLVAGDVYDRALPPVDAVELWGQTLVRLREAGARVVVISGNHDSARRLGAGAGLYDHAQVHVRSDVRRCGVPVLADLDDGGSLAIYAVPYLEPDAVRSALVTEGGPAEDELRTHAQVLRAALDRCRADLGTRKRTRAVAMAHAFVAGGEACDSERELCVGGAAQVPTGAFAGFDYAALGHLHGRQILADGAIRYAGSPLPYSFSEEHHRKSMWLAEVTAAGLGMVTEVPTRVPRRLARLRGPLDALLTDPGHEPLEDCWLSVTLTDPECPVQAMPRLQQRFPHALELQWRPEGGLVSEGGTYAERVAERDDLGVVREFVRHVRNTPPRRDEDAVLGDAVAEALAAEVAS